MKVLVADKLSDVALDGLGHLGMTVSYQPGLAAGALAGALDGVQVLVVRSTRISAETLEAAPSLSLIVRAGAGVNTIDVAEAAARGIYVTNCPGRNKDAVAELAIGLLIACDRQIVNASQALRSGLWQKKRFGQAHGLRGRTLGIVGVGAIGAAVARIAQGMGMEVLAWSPSLTEEKAEALGARLARDPLQIARESDAVSLHTAYVPATHHLVDEPFLQAMKDGAILVNTARGAVVDTEALKAAILSKGLRVGLDVFEEEPAGGEAPFPETSLAQLVTATPHIAASTAQASEAVASEVVHIVAAFKRSGRPLNVVNVASRSPATHGLVVRHLNRVGVLASVLGSLRQEGINVEEMDNTIFAGARAACCTLHLDRAPTEETLGTLRVMDSILQISLEGRGA